MLWDLGLKVGHATRSVDECMRQANGDMTIRTAMLEARYLWGEQGLYDELKRRFQREVMTGDAVGFVEAKLAEREARHARLGRSEEHTSELQSLMRISYAVFCLKKKKPHYYNQNIPPNT